MTIWRGIKGVGVEGGGAAIPFSRSPPKVQTHSSTVTHDDWTVARVFQLTAHTHTLACSAVYFGASPTFPQISSRGCGPREGWKVCGFILGGWVPWCFFPGYQRVASGEHFM